MRRSLLLIFAIAVCPHVYAQLYTLPLKYSTDERYFVDQNNKPFPVFARRLSFVDSLYKNSLDSIVDNGFNSISISMPGNVDRELVDSFISYCESKNVVVFLSDTNAGNNYKEHKNVVTAFSSAYSNCPAKPALSYNMPWQGWLNNISGYITDSAGIKGINTFIQTYSWWQLIPSGQQGMKKLITGGHSKAVAAATPAGTLLVAYIPRNHKGDITVDMTVLNSASTAKWYDPFSETYKNISGTFSNTSPHSFSSPNSNIKYGKEWLLVIQSTASLYANPKITKPLTVSSNPNYFQDETGKPIILCGSHTWNSLQDWGSNGTPQALDFDSFVKFLQHHGHNMTLLWTTELPKFHQLPTAEVNPPDLTVTPFPYLRTGPGVATDGKPKFDLTKFNQAYFDRLRERVQKLNDAGIYAGVYLFSGEWLLRFRSATDGYPYTGSNNINHIDDGYREDSSFTAVASITMRKENAITRMQDEYVKKLINTLNDLPNVLWIVSQEAPPTSAWWNERLIDFTREYEKGKPLQHPIGLGGYDNSLNDSTIYHNNADWVAPWSRVSPVRSCGSGKPPCKVNVNDSDHSYWEIWLESPQKNRNYVWENFVNGNQVLFMDPYVLHYPRQSRNNFASSVNNISSAPNPRWDNVRDNMGYILRYSRRMNLSKALPHAELSSTKFCLAQVAPRGAEYLVYAPAGGSFTVDLSAMSASRRLSVEWFNPANGLSVSGKPVAAGNNKQVFMPPFCGDAVLYLVDVTLPTPTPPHSPTSN